MNLGDQLKALVETALKNAIESKSDELMGNALEELKKLIPGQVDDIILDAIKPQLLPIVKAELLKLVDQISKDV